MMQRGWSCDWPWKPGSLNRDGVRLLRLPPNKWVGSVIGNILVSKTSVEGSWPSWLAKLVYLYDAMSEQLGRSLQNFLDWCNSNWRFHTISCGCSSVGRAPRCQRDCRRFDSDHPLQTNASETWKSERSYTPFSVRLTFLRGFDPLRWYQTRFR